MSQLDVPHALTDIQAALRRGALSCRQLVKQYLQNIERSRALNAYVEVYEEVAMKRASELDRRHQAGEQMGRLFGAVLSLKDVIALEGQALTASSKILQGYRSLFSATAVRRVLEEDAIIIGRTNCDEFAMGSDNTNSHYGPVRNALDPDRVPGGSSGGAAVSVQADTCLMAIGSDTGGSVRQPAAFCDLIGFKPSYGRISRHGLIAYGSSFDQIGVIGRSLSDIKELYQVMCGPDDFDGTLVPAARPEATPLDSPLRIGYISDAINHTGLDPAIKSAFTACMDRLRAAGHSVESLTMPHFDYIIPAYYVLTSAEASSNLSRYDGVRYGYRTAQAATLDGLYTRTRTEGFGTEVKRRILLGTFVLSVGYYDAYFAKAQKVRRLLKNQYEAWTDQYDLVMLPTTPTTAWKLDEELSPVEMYLADVYSVLANMVGAPAISLPFGYDPDGLSFGTQLLCARHREDKLFAMAEELYRTVSAKAST